MYSNHILGSSWMSRIGEGERWIIKDKKYEKQNPRVQESHWIPT